MKRIIALAIGFLLSLNFVFAQKNDRSAIRIRLSDGSPLLVTINGRDFKKTGRSITIGDIPRKRQNIQVYRFRPYADGNGGKAELVYSGTIKLVKGSTYDCIVDLATRKFRMKEVSSLAPLAERPPFNPNQSQPITQDNSNAAQEEVTLDMPPDRTVSNRLQPLKTAMDKTDADSKKLAEARKFIQQNTVTSEEVKQIAGWLFFDDNRMLFVKQAYSRVSDKNNFTTVAEVFTLAESKREFNSFLNSK